MQRGVQIMAVLVLGLQIALATQVPLAAGPPHIVLILCDDYGYSDIGYHNVAADGLLRTPNFDSLAAAGIKLENYYVQPICTPTRSQLLSGRYQIHTGLQHGVIHPQMPSGLNTSFRLISDELRSLGYATHLVGKWHIGFYNNASCPWNRGFDTTVGYLGGEEDYWTHVRDPGFDFRRNGVPDRADATTVDGNTSLYSTKLFRDEAVALINAHVNSHPIGAANKPFFLYLPFQAVHSPLQAPKFWLDKQPPVASFGNSTDRRTYAAMVEQLDFAVGKVVDALNTTEMWLNTVLIVSADNGGIEPGGFNYPLRGEKATLWEGGMRANGFVASPLLHGGFNYRGLVHVSDWYPTLLGLAGGNPNSHPYLDGHDVWTAITTNGSSPRTELLHNIDIFNGLGQHGFGNAAIRVGSLKLIVGGPGNGTYHLPPGCSSCSTPPHSPSPCVADSTNTTLWLFDILADPRETCNLVQSKPLDVERLLARLAEYNKTQVAVQYPADDPASNPALRSGIEKGVWGPWRPNPNP